MNKINLVYFSCARDLKMLKMSIDSSRRNYDFSKIFVFSDPNGPIFQKDLDEGVEVIQRGCGSEKLYGLDNIRDMHLCLLKAAKGCDYVLKKDSDVLDCSDYAYKRLEIGGWDCYGAFPMARPELIPDGHFNGNAYFIKSNVIRSFPEIFPRDVSVWSVLNFPEDMVTSHICGKVTKDIKIDGTAQNFDGKYVFDVFLSKVAAADPDEIKQYGFAHCRSNPHIMKYLFEKIYERN